MFGGAWSADRAVEAGSVAVEEISALGVEALTVIARTRQRWHQDQHTPLGDPATAATVVWVGLHGLAHQRLVAPGFPWPPDVESRLIAARTSLSAQNSDDDVSEGSSL